MKPRTRANHTATRNGHEGTNRYRNHVVNDNEEVEDDDDETDDDDVFKYVEDNDDDDEEEDDDAKPACQHRLAAAGN